MWFCLGVPQGTTLGPLHVWFPASCINSETQHCVCGVHVPPERLLCPLVFTYTHGFLLVRSQRGVWSELSEWPPLDVPPAAPTPFTECVCVCLRGSSVHDPKTEHRQRAERRHTHPDNHTRLMITITTEQVLRRHKSVWERICFSEPFSFYL